MAITMLAGPQVSLAGAEGIPEGQYDQYRTWILHAEDRRGALEKMKDSPRPHTAVYTGILEPLFNRKDLTAHLDEAARRDLFFDLVKHLAEQEPEDENAPLLFGPEIVRLLASDPVLLERLRNPKGGLFRDPQTREQPGWERIRKRALEFMVDHSRPAETRRAAIRLASECTCVQVADALAALWDALQEEAGSLGAADAAAYLDAVEKLLLHRFPDVDALVGFLGALKDRFEGRASWTNEDRERIRGSFLEDIIRLIASKGGQVESQARQSALEYGRRLIERATTPQDLTIFFDPKRTTYVELQRLALAQARKLKPTADAPWADLLASALRSSDDPAVLEGLLALVTETFTVRAKQADHLAEAVADRLADVKRGDSQEHRERLATILGRIGSLKDVLTALGDRRFSAADDPQQGVWSRLIRALGLVEDGLVVTLLPYYRPRAASGRPQLWERVATARALGSKAFHTSPLQGPQAAVFLRHILTGEGVKAVKIDTGTNGETKSEVQIFWGEGLGTEEAAKALEAGTVVLDLAADPEGGDPAPEVRQAALRSLQYYPELADTAEILAGVAAADGESGAEALKVLGRLLATGSQGAARALAELIRKLEDPKRLPAALDAVLAVEAPSSAAARDLLGRAVLDILQGESATDAIRRKAAAVAAHLAYLPAIKSVSLAWNGVAETEEEARAAWFGLLQDLVVAVAKSGASTPAVDPKLAEALRELATTEHLVDALGLFDAMGADAERFELKRLRADLHWELSAIPEGGTREQRRAKLDDAIRFYRELLEQGPAASVGELQASIYRFLRERSKPEWLAEGESATSFQLEAVKAAALSGQAAVAKEALEQLVPALQQATLEPAEKTELDANVAKLTEIVAQ